MTDFAPNVGAAILPSSNKPLAHYMRFQQQQREDEAAKAKAREQNLNNSLQLMKYSPSEYFEPFSKQVNDNFQANVMEFGFDHINKGGRWDDPTFQKELNNRLSESKVMTDKTLQIESAFDEVKNAIGKDNDINADSAKAELNSLLFDEDSRARNWEEVNPEDFEAVMKNPAHYNKASIFSNFADELPYIVDENSKIIADKFGGSYTQTDKIKGKLLVKDEEGNIITNDKGQPIIQLSDDVYKMANNVDKIANYLAQFPPEQRKRVLFDELKTYAGAIETSDRITSRRAPSSEGSDSVNQRFNNMVDDIIKSLQNAYRTHDGDYGSQLTKQAKALVPLLKGARLGSGIVDDVRFISGKASGGNDRIELRVKTGSAGGETVFRTEKLDLTDEGSYSNLLSMLQSLKNKEGIMKVFEMNQQNQVDFADLIEEDQEPQKQDGLEMDNY